MGGSLTIGSVFTENLVVGVGDMAVSNRPGITVSTYALGSCVGLVAYDPTTKAGGLIHIMLPDSKLSPEKAQRNPACFADTGLPKFFNALAGMGIQRSRTHIFIGGGANVLNTGSDMFKIGSRNITAVKDFLNRNRIPIHFESVGGFDNRTIHLKLQTGEMTLKMPQGKEYIDLS